MSDETRNLMDKVAELSKEVPEEDWAALARARLRERMAKDPEAPPMGGDFKEKMRAIIERDGVEVVHERIFGDPSWAGVQTELDTQTDEEVADVLTTISGQYHFRHPMAVLLCNAAQRLRRAGGGPTYTAEDHIDEVRAREKREAGGDK